MFAFRSHVSHKRTGETAIVLDQGYTPAGVPNLAVLEIATGRTTWWMRDDVIAVA